ncbi:hypothetical protein A3Q56_04343 [Intoshia linei]|uniref:Glycine--tRNA ligase n=1 Tax=Intoshia linei TaxID=1819745 RepID=A0A177B2G5_9BILA|nr:hypothetical protein A3Q56_04343 [Intoshia linei]
MTTSPTLVDQIKNQGNIIRKLKESKSAKEEIESAVKELKALKLKFDETKPLSSVYKFEKEKVDYLLKQRFFMDQSFSIYGGVSGFIDFGPMGCAVKNNIINLWRNFFINSANSVYEIDCPVITYDKVFEASGHVAKFIDYKVKDVKTGDCFRLDHLISANLKMILKKKHSDVENEKINKILAQIDGYDVNQMQQLINEYKIKSPVTGNDLSEPTKFNLMFSTKIGAAGHLQGYLRPETAQGMFLNFANLLKFNDNKLPFAAAQIGKAYRNEISPRSGLIRCREFLLAEIEYFYDSSDGGKHSEFTDSIQKTIITLYSSDKQLENSPAFKISIGEALDQKIIQKENVAYYIAKIFHFLKKIGINTELIRFRQHLPNEMAHYACDCWDAEILMSSGWVECVGCSDRSCYDLDQHSKHSGISLIANKVLEKPLEKMQEIVKISKRNISRKYTSQTSNIVSKINAMSFDDKKQMCNEIEKIKFFNLKINKDVYQINSDMVSIKTEKFTIHIEDIHPHVIEPSFGIGRIMQALFEHSIRTRKDDENRTFLSLPVISAPYKCSVIPLSKHDDLIPVANLISTNLRKIHIAHRIETSSSSIGKMYARTDQLGIPYAVTIDFDSVRVSPSTVTIRERDSMEQIRIPVTDVCYTLNLIIDQPDSGWNTTREKYGLFKNQINKI